MYQKLLSDLMNSNILVVDNEKEVLDKEEIDLIVLDKYCHIWEV
ncbi:hypothetical protein [Clostridium gasigenes]|nr:hypothetical protein [Clostridium gasigenes]